MRLLWSLVAVLIVAAPAAADTLHVTLAYGSLPDHPIELPEMWLQMHEIPLVHIEGEMTEFEYPTAQMYHVVETICECDADAHPTGESHIINIHPHVTNGTYIVTLLLIGPQAETAVLRAPAVGGTAAKDVTVTVRVPASHELLTTATLAGAADEGGVRVLTYANLAAGTAFLVAPADVVPAGSPQPPQPDRPALQAALVPAIAGLLVGMLLWWLLVSRGVVQKRSRKQVASTAAHKAGPQDPKVLEARRRVLMAALKDLEMARMNKEVEAAAYDAVKADLKRQTVAVMRALEEQK